MVNSKYYTIHADTPQECFNAVIKELKRQRGSLVQSPTRDNTQKSKRERATQFGVYDAIIAMFEQTKVVPKGWTGQFYEGEENGNSEGG